MQAGQTYYWRLDEVRSEDNAKKGEIWSFTVVDYVVDDFESYGDGYDEETFEGPTIWNTWIDGWFTGTSGAIVGYYNSPFAETITVHGGFQAMPLFYDNDGTILEGDAEFETSGVPYYSETQRTWAEPQDWTRRDVEVLSLWFYGDPDNAVERLYVALEDSAGNRKEVAHPDPAAITAERWEQWAIPLVDFTGVDPTTIKMMGIGIGDPASNQPGGTGLVRVDDIELHRSSGQ